MASQPLNAEQEELQQREFLILLGRSATVWAQLESSLCILFSRITRMDPTLARRIFYSARSFLGRADMLKAAIACPTVQLNSTDDAFIRECVKRAGQYASVRNAIAHDCIVFFGFDGHDLSWQHVIVDGKFDRYIGDENALSAEQLSRFHANISHFFILIQLFIQREASDAETRAGQYLSLLQELPTSPREHTLDPSKVELLLSLLPTPFQIRI